MSENLRRDVFVVVPCYNAGDRLRGVVARLKDVVDHVILVDDGSTDGAAQALRYEVSAVVTIDYNMGKGHALLIGFQSAVHNAQMRCVVTLDADGQHDPAEIPKLYEAFVREKADLVIGARQFGGEHVPWRSWFGNELTAFLVRVLLGKRIPDTQSGFRLHSRRFLESAVKDVEGGRYETEMEIVVKAVRGGWRLVSVPIETIYEPGNVSSHFNKVRDSWRIYRRLLQSLGKHTLTK